MKPVARRRRRKESDKPSGTGTHRLPLETHFTQPLGRARGDAPQGRWRGGKESGRGCREVVQGRAPGENIKKFFFRCAHVSSGIWSFPSHLVGPVRRLRLRGPLVGGLWLGVPLRCYLAASFRR